MKIYLSYPMSGQPDHGIPLATDIAADLRELGYDILAPHEIMHGDGVHENPEFTHADYIREDIRKGLSRCEAIALCDGWVYSRGCQQEFAYAAMLSYRVFTVQEDLEFGGWRLEPMDGKGWYFL